MNLHLPGCLPWLIFADTISEIREVSFWKNSSVPTSANEIGVLGTPSLPASRSPGKYNFLLCMQYGIGKLMIMMMMIVIIDESFCGRKASVSSPPWLLTLHTHISSKQFTLEQSPPKNMIFHRVAREQKDGSRWLTWHSEVISAVGVKGSSRRKKFILPSEEWTALKKKKEKSRIRSWIKMCSNKP